MPGGQETGPSIATATPGELTAAWLFFNNYGTFATAAFSGVSTNVTTTAIENLFDDESCSDNIACAGKTVLGSWHMA
jgi:hypothetical protein